MCHLSWSSTKGDCRFNYTNFLYMSTEQSLNFYCADQLVKPKLKCPSNDFIGKENSEHADLSESYIFRTCQLPDWCGTPVIPNMNGMQNWLR